jgi:hypothetical protein
LQVCISFTYEQYKAVSEYMYIITEKKIVGAYPRVKLPLPVFLRTTFFFLCLLSSFSVISERDMVTSSGDHGYLFISLCLIILYQIIFLRL